MKQTARRQNARSTPRDQGFSFGSGSAYADAAEYAEKALTFDILAVVFEPKRGFEGRDRWALTVQVKGRDPEILTLGSNPKRDEQLRQAEAYLKRGGVIKNKRLRLSGGAYYLEDA
jgi:hypothetical protein